jgi:EmrB/QacA subfamily drug resistance transporter
LSNKELKRAALTVAIFASFLTPFLGSAINIALPSIGKEFQANAIALSWVATAYLLSAAIFLVPFGRAADIIGRKKVFVIGLILITTSSLFCAISTSIIWLIASRVFQAIGSSMLFGTGMAIITSVFPKEERGKAMGIIVSSVYVGLSVGPFVGGLMTEYLGWRSIFYVIVPLGIAVIYISIKKLKGEWADAKGEKFDWIGSIIYGIALFLIIYGFSELPEKIGFVTSISGLIILFVFIWWEGKVKDPVFDLNLFRKNVTFRYSNLAALINYSATFAVAFLLSLYLQYNKGMNARDAGIVLVIQPIVMAVLSPYFGKLSDKIDAGKIASTGMAFSTLGIVLLVFLNDQSSIVYILATLVLLGLGFAMFSSPNTNAIMSSVDKKYYGIASGSVGTMRLVGQMFSMGITMLLFSVFIGKVEIIPEYYSQFLTSMKTAFIIFAVLCFFGIFASLARGKINMNNRNS